MFVTSVGRVEPVYANEHSIGRCTCTRKPHCLQIRAVEKKKYIHNENIINTKDGACPQYFQRFLTHQIAMNQMSWDPINVASAPA